MNPWTNWNGFIAAVRIQAIESRMRNDGNFWTCTVCDTTVDETHLKDHINSRSHKRKVEWMIHQEENRGNELHCMLCNIWCTAEHLKSIGHKKNLNYYEPSLPPLPWASICDDQYQSVHNALAPLLPTFPPPPPPIVNMEK